MKAPSIGIRREDKSPWERRVPLVPHHVERLVQQGIRVVVQPSAGRIHPDAEYARAGAAVDDDLSTCRVVFGVKEMPVTVFRPGQAYVFFSHTIKGQSENMAMLQVLLERGCHLIDYERVVDEGGKRLIFFGWHAGVAGMVESLVALGARLQHEGVRNPFAGLQPPHRYVSLDAMRHGLDAVATSLRADGVPEALRPLIIGITGYGNVSRGAQEMLDHLPVTTITPESLPDLDARSRRARDTLFKVVFEERHLARRRDGSGFELQHYYAHPDAYDSIIEDALPSLTMLVNCMYWEPRFPRLVTRAWLRRAWAGSRLKVIGDIGCDIDGAIEITSRATDPGDPCYVWEPATGSVHRGVRGDGPVVMAVDILPTELPADASRHFSDVLLPFVPALARADYDVPLPELALPPPIRQALIVHRGSLTPDYRHLAEHLPSTP